MSDIAIRIEHLSKMYRLGLINSGMLRKDIQSWFARKLGKEDPNSKIGDDRFKGDKDHFWALKDVSFEIKQGDRVGIIGKNGAGKSTILKILSRITAPTEGIVKIKGKIASLLEVGTGFHGELTGRENIYLNGAILGMKKKSIDKKLDEIIAFSGIEHHIDTPVKRYSSGMFVRLAFAVAAHLDSDILIADEVLAVGDVGFQGKALDKMKKLNTEEGRTILYVSHNMSTVKYLCNNGLFFEKGKIIKQDNINEIIDTYYSLLPHTLSKDDLSTNDQTKRRSSNTIKVTHLSFSKKEYLTSENIYLSFSFEILAPLERLCLGIVFKRMDKSQYIGIDHVLVDKPIEKGFTSSYELEIPKNTLPPGRFPIYFVLQDITFYKMLGPAVNTEILDECIQPVTIKLDKNEYKIPYDFVIINSKIKKIR